MGRSHSSSGHMCLKQSQTKLTGGMGRGGRRGGFVGGIPPTSIVDVVLVGHYY